MPGLGYSSGTDSAGGGRGLGSIKTFDNLKRAAAGVHGAGDLLRGTFNSSIDKRFHQPDNPAFQKNEEVMERGRYEAENQRFYHPDGPMPQLDQIRESYEPSDHSNPAAAHQAAVPEYPTDEDLGRPRSRFSGMFKKDRSPSVGPSDPPRKLKKMKGVV